MEMSSSFDLHQPEADEGAQLSGVDPDGECLKAVANVSLPTAKEGIPVEIFGYVPSGEMSSHPQIGARLSPRVEKRQTLWCQRPVRLISIGTLGLAR
jgi:hypothetical protein